MKKKTDSLSTGLTSPPEGGTIQIGSIIAYYGKSAPDTWLLCDGSAIPSGYTQLIALCGLTTPNLCARIPVGAGTGTDANGNSYSIDFADEGGEFKQTLTVEQMPSHQHFGWGEVTNPNPWGTGSSSNTGFKGSGDSDYDNHLYGSTFTGGNPSDLVATDNGSVTGITAGATSAHNNVQPYLGINYIIYAGEAED